MSKKDVNIDVCDVCEFDRKDPLKTVTANTCEVCERDFCGQSKHTGDNYSTTMHMDSPMTHFICAECWELSKHFGYKTGTSPLPKGSINKHSSGSTTAINMGEFREYIEFKAKEYSEEAIIRILKAVRAGAKDKVDMEALKKEVEQRHEEELGTIMQRKYEEAKG